MNSRYQLCDEVEQRISRNRLKCKSNELAVLARQSGMSYGKFMNALYQRGIEVILVDKVAARNKRKEKERKMTERRDPKPYQDAKIRSLTYYIAVFDRQTGEEVARFNTITAMGEAYGMCNTTCQQLLRNPDKPRTYDGYEQLRQQYIFCKMPKEKGVIACG